MSLDSVGKRRLLLLAGFLEKLPRKKFDYSIWAGDDWNGGSHSCGSSGCALGWAATLPSFSRAGFHLVQAKYIDKKVAIPTFKEVFGVDAGAKFFHISGDAALALFDPHFNSLGEKATPKQVAKKIRKFVANGGVVYQ